MYKNQKRNQQQQKLTTNKSQMFTWITKVKNKQVTDEKDNLISNCVNNWTRK